MIHHWFRESEIQVVMLPLNQTKLFKLLCKKVRETGKLLVDEPRNRSNFPNSTNSSVRFLAVNALTQEYLVQLWLVRSAS